MCVVSYSTDYVEKYHIPLAKSLMAYTNRKDLRIKREREKILVKGRYKLIENDRNTWISLKDMLSKIAKLVSFKHFSFQRQKKKLENSTCVVSFSTDYAEKCHVPLTKSLMEYTNRKDLTIKRAVIGKREHLNSIPPCKVCINDHFCAQQLWRNCRKKLCIDR